MNYSTPTVLNQQEIKISNIVVVLAMIFKKHGGLFPSLEGKSNTNINML